MFSRIHNRLGTAGFVLAIVALVAALAGTAFAVGGLTAKQKKEVAKISKREAKKVVRAVVGPPGPAGAKGDTGTTGSPWTAGNILPSGATETGSWGAVFTGEGIAMISFPVPLAAPLDKDHVKKVEKEESAPAQCDNGSGEAPSSNNPEADPGFLCVFVTAFEGGGEIPVGGVVDPGTIGSGAGKFGAGVLLNSGGAALGIGSFAVTAP